MKKLLFAYIAAALLLAACTKAQPQETGAPDTNAPGNAPSGSAELVEAPEGGSGGAPESPGGGLASWYEEGSGGELRVQLPANPSTGYIWIIKNRDPGLIENAGEEYVYDARSRNLPGAAGLWSAIFRAKEGREGRTELKLLYRRVFEAVAVSEKVLDIEVSSGKLKVLGVREAQNVPVVLPDGTHTVKLSSGRLGEEEGRFYADITEPMTIVLSDAEVEALKPGGMINLAPYGMSYIEVTEMEELSEGHIRAADGAELVRDEALGGWKIVTYDDDVYEYEDEVYRLFFEEDVPFVDEMSEIAYGDANRFGTFRGCLENYGNLRAEVSVKDGAAQKITLRYHP